MFLGGVLSTQNGSEGQQNPFQTCFCHPQVSRRGSSVGSDAARDAKCTAIDPRIRHILSKRFGHENISSAILPLSLVQEEQFQFMAKECILSTGKPPLGGLPRNSVVRTTDRPDMTLAVYCDRKASTQTNKSPTSTSFHVFFGLLCAITCNLCTSAIQPVLRSTTE